jgi:cytochrome c-type biogenesis protein CcmH/NrfG
MSFWRELIELVLDHETRRQVQEQVEWIEREPGNARPYYHLAQFCRMQSQTERGLALLLEAVRLDPELHEAHAALAEIYAVTSDYRAAWRHARKAERGGVHRGVDLLRRHGIPEPGWVAS